MINEGETMFEFEFQKIPYGFSIGTLEVLSSPHITVDCGYVFKG